MAASHRLICIAGAVIFVSPAQAQTGRDLGSVISEIDQGFVCPQFRPDDDARRADMIVFSRAIASVGPTKISYRQAAYIHAKMLERHNCTQRTTVVSAESDPAPVAAAPVATPASVEAPPPN